MKRWAIYSLLFHCNFSHAAYFQAIQPMDLPSQTDVQVLGYICPKQDVLDNGSSCEVHSTVQLQEQVGAQFPDLKKSLHKAFSEMQFVGADAMLSSNGMHPILIAVTGISKKVELLTKAKFKNAFNLLRAKMLPRTESDRIAAHEKASKEILIEKANEAARIQEQKKARGLIEDEGMLDLSAARQYLDTLDIPIGGYRPTINRSFSLGKYKTSETFAKCKNLKILDGHYNQGALQHIRIKCEGPMAEFDRVLYCKFHVCADKKFQLTLPSKNAAKLKIGDEPEITYQFRERAFE